MTRSLRHDESGFTLIEVLVAAFLVAAVAVGTLETFDAAGASAGRQRVRAEATTLIQQDSERVRATSPVTVASWVPTPPASALPAPVTRHGITYTTTRTVAWRNDVNSGITCSGAANGTRYLSVTSTVSWTEGIRANAHSVSSTNQLAVPITGNRLIVQVFNRTKDPQANFPVVLKNSGGTTVDTVNTSTAGCVEWDFLTPGTYSVNVTQTGYVDPAGRPTASKTVNVAATGANTIGLDYDQAATVTLKPYTQYTAVQAPWCMATPCPKNYPPAGSGVDQVTAQSSGQPADRVFGTLGSFQTQLTTSGDGAPPSLGLFPFASPVTIFPGTCLPTVAGVTLALTPTLTPGSTQTLELRMPEFDINALYKLSKNGGTSPATGARIVLDRQVGDGCPGFRLPDRFADSAGNMPFSGVPSGLYNVCVQYTRAGVTYYSDPSGTVDVRDYAAPASYSVVIGAYSGNGQSLVGTCP